MHTFDRAAFKVGRLPALGVLLLASCSGSESRPDAGNLACGDGVCNSADGETEANCEKDCSGRCVTFPDDPVFCWDDRGNPTCNPRFTDCNLPHMYECGSGPRRCPDYESFGRCCDTADRTSSDVIWCPSLTSCQNPVAAPRVCYGPVFSCATGM